MLCLGPAVAGPPRWSLWPLVVCYCCTLEDTSQCSSNTAWCHRSVPAPDQAHVIQARCQRPLDIWSSVHFGWSHWSPDTSNPKEPRPDSGMPTLQDLLLQSPRLQNCLLVWVRNCSTKRMCVFQQWDTGPALCWHGPDSFAGPGSDSQTCSVEAGTAHHVACPGSARGLELRHLW